MTIIEHPSPNHNARPRGVRPDLIVLHGTAGRSDAGDLAWLCDQARKPDGGIYDTSLSYHYLVGRDGRVYRLVPDERRAWHAGKSVWEGRADCNDYSLGIGVCNDGREPYGLEQVRAVGALAAELCQRWQIVLSRIVGHCQVSPGRKTDPWLHFPWGLFFDALVAAR